MVEPFTMTLAAGGAAEVGAVAAAGTTTAGASSVAITGAQTGVLAGSSATATGALGGTALAGAGAAEGVSIGALDVASHLTVESIASEAAALSNTEMAASLPTLGESTASLAVPDGYSLNSLHAAIDAAARDSLARGGAGLGVGEAGVINPAAIGPERIAGRLPINSELAGQTVPLESFNGLSECAEYAGRTIHFSEGGFPDFGPWTHVTESSTLADTQIPLSGSRAVDVTRANANLGLPHTPEGFVWHHHQQVGRMQLVPADLHSAVRHSGGIAVHKAAGGRGY